jgi:cell wall-associated NlpC family hydrolase
MATFHPEHPFELTLAEVAKRAADAQMNVERATVRAERISLVVFCGHGASYAGSCPGGYDCYGFKLWTGFNSS